LSAVVIEVTERLTNDGRGVNEGGVLIGISDPNTPEPEYTHQQFGSTTMARILLIIAGLIAIVVRQFFPCSDLPQGDNPDGVRCFFRLHSSGHTND